VREARVIGDVTVGGVHAIVALSIAVGLTVRETAQKLEVSTLTVCSQLASAMAKLEVDRRAELITFITGLIPGLSTI